MPYKNRSHFNIDTFIEYEPCVYKNYLYNDLSALSQKFGDIKDIVNALDEVEPLDDKVIPSDAFEREFIGNSSFPTNFTLSSQMPLSNMIRYHKKGVFL